MIKFGTRTKAWIFFTLIMAAGWTGSAQGVVLRGLIVDSIAQSPISNASISIKGLRGGARSNAEGRFGIPTNQREITIVVSSVGYNTETLQLDSIPGHELLFTLSRKAQQLKAAVVKNKSQR